VKEVIILPLSLTLFLSPLDGQQVESISLRELSSITSHSNDTTYVVNFWATWCSPCVKEIGYFEELHREYDQKNLKVYLVSLDFPNQLERRVIPFLRDREITAEVMLMTNLDYNSWIDQVDPSWSGSIPATLIYRNDQRIFLERELTREELFTKVHQIRN
jgi:thiol-disulfide isomerase/thioredoxin